MKKSRKDFEEDAVIFSGSSNNNLAKAISSYLKKPLGKIKLKKFSDGENEIEIHTNVRDDEVFVIQSTCYPANDNWIELFLIVDALKRASAKRITAVIPYYGYARQDKKVKPRVPISAKLMADLLTTAGAHRVITIDFHANQIQGFFNIPVDNLFAQPILIEYIRKNLADNLVIVSPDAGGVERARSYAKKLNAGLAIIDKRRDAPNKAKAMSIIGPVNGKRAIIVDDMVDTAGTLTEGAKVVKEKGAKEIYACCTHAVLSGPAIDRINNSPLKSVVVTDTISLDEKINACPKLISLSVANLLGEAMIRSFTGESVTSLFI